MTRQEMFNRAAQGILAQGCASYDTDRQACMYRGPNNTKCAIGYLMPDGKYSFSLEYIAPYNKDVQKAAGIKWNQADFAVRLQQCHDEAAIKTGGIFIERFIGNMREFARHYKLDASVLDR
jgi:hypothetical protein